MKAIILAASLLALSFVDCQMFDPNVCGPDGQARCNQIKEIKKQCLKYLSDSGDEGKAKKCVPTFVGKPGEEANKENCKKNSEIIEKASECFKPYTAAIRRNVAFLVCAGSVPGPYLYAAPDN